MVIKDSNVILKIVNSKVEIVGVMSDYDLAKRYVDDLNMGLGGKGIFYKLQPTDNLDGIYNSGEVKVIPKTYYIEVKGYEDLSEFTVLGKKEGVKPKNYIDDNGMYHVFLDCAEDFVMCVECYANLGVEFLNTIKSISNKDTDVVKDTISTNKGGISVSNESEVQYCKGDELSISNRLSKVINQGSKDYILEYPKGMPRELLNSVIDNAKCIFITDAISVDKLILKVSGGDLSIPNEDTLFTVGIFGYICRVVKANNQLI